MPEKMNCDRIAGWYCLLEYLAFGRALETCRFQYLDQIAGTRCVLILGDGDGRFTAEFVRSNSLVRVDSVELSAGMLALARDRVGERELDAGRVRFFLGDARTIELQGDYDLIITHFFLDCFAEDELRGLVAHISARCSPRARWLVSEFRLPDGGCPRVAAKALIRVMYFFFQVATGLKVKRLSEYVPVLEKNGFRIDRRCSRAGGLLVSELWERTPPNM